MYDDAVVAELFSLVVFTDDYKDADKSLRNNVPEWMFYTQAIISICRKNKKDEQLQKAPVAPLLRPLLSPVAAEPSTTVSGIVSLHGSVTKAAAPVVTEFNSGGTVNDGFGYDIAA